MVDGLLLTHYIVNSEHCHVYSLCTGGILAKWADDNRLGQWFSFLGNSTSHKLEFETMHAHTFGLAKCVTWYIPH